jgi:putative tricarboxylic transport membrane protein
MGFLFIPGLIATFSFVVILVALQLDESPEMIVGESMQPRVFPILLMIINLGLTAILFFDLRRIPPKKVPLEGFRTWGSILLFLLFYVFTVYLDMLIAIAVVMFFMCLLWGERRLIVAAAVSLGAPTIIFIVFDLVLRVRFPRGLFTNWYYG